MIEKYKWLIIAGFALLVAVAASGGV